MKLFISKPMDETPGAMWPGTTDGREGWFIRLPDGRVWHTRHRSTNESEGEWTVTGEAPTLTVTPSINTGTWHGFITNGELVAA